MFWISLVSSGHGSVVTLTRKQWFSSYKDLQRFTKNTGSWEPLNGLYLFHSIERRDNEGTMRGGNRRQGDNLSHNWDTKSRSESWAEITGMSRVLCVGPWSQVRLILRHLSPGTKHYDLSTFNNLPGCCSANIVV